MEGSNWTDLLVEPKAVLEPYQSMPPSLLSFAPHSFRLDFDTLAIAGQFLELPRAPSEKWRYGDQIRAYAVFQFVKVLKLRTEGVLVAAEGDDIMHGIPEGESGTCTLEQIPSPLGDIPCRKFTIKTSTFNLEVEASYVELICGRNARSQYGWPNAV